METSTQPRGYQYKSQDFPWTFLHRGVYTVPEDVMESSRPLMDFLPKSLYTIQSSLEVQLGCMSNDVHNAWLYHKLSAIPLTKDCLLMNSNNYYITSRCYLQAIVINISREETWNSRTSLTGCQLQGTPQHTCTWKEKIYAASSDCNPIFIICTH